MTFTSVPRRRLTAALAAVVTLTPLAAGPLRTPTATASPPGSPAGELVVTWNRVAMDALTPSGRPVVVQPFVVAAMHVAMYDAVMAVEPYARPFATRIDAPAGASAEVAAVVAAHRVLREMVPTASEAFDTALTASLAGLPDGPARTAGTLVGEAAGWGTLALRHDDGSQQGTVPPLPTPGPGVWAPTPPSTGGLAPWLATARPFSLRRVDQFRPAGPPPITSARFARDLDEVRRLGGTTSTERTPEQTTVARFWADQPVAQGQRALRGQAARLGWGLAPTARLFAAVLTSQADALAACWDAKFHHVFWRPWQAVPTVEPGWTPLLTTPSHPEYPSAHGCLTGALGTALARVMGTEAIELDIDAANIGVTRHYATLDALRTEVGEARIWGGLHYRTSVEAGLRLADRVVRFNLDRHFELRG